MAKNTAPTKPSRAPSKTGSPKKVATATRKPAAAKSKTATAAKRPSRAEMRERKAATMGAGGGKTAKASAGGARSKASA